MRIYELGRYSFSVIHENKILAKISETTVLSRQQIMNVLIICVDEQAGLRLCCSHATLSRLLVMLIVVAYM